MHLHGTDPRLLFSMLKNFIPLVVLFGRSAMAVNAHELVAGAVIARGGDGDVDAGQEAGFSSFMSYHPWQVGNIPFVFVRLDVNDVNVHATIYS